MLVPSHQFAQQHLANKLGQVPLLHFSLVSQWLYKPVRLLKIYLLNGYGKAGKAEMAVYHVIE